MADIITRLKFETDEFSNKARRMTTEINDITHKMEVAGNAVAHTNSRNLKLAQSFGTVQTASTTLRGKISELQDSFIAWSHHYNQLTDQQRRDPYGRAIVQQLDILKQRIRETKSELSGIEGEMGGGKIGFGSKFMQSMVPGLGMGVGAAGAMMAVKAVGVMKDVVKEGIQVNMEFEQSNANLAAVLGKTSGEISALTENAKKLGASTLFTANQITELQTVLARRGLGEGQILQMTHGISNLALATGTGLADAAELAASTMQSFGMRASEMERIVSVLGVSTTKSALTMEKLGTSLQYVAPTARAAGFSLEDTVAMLGKLVDSGLDASTAGTSLRQIILAMSTDNGKLARSFGKPVRGLNDFIEALEHVSDAEDLLSDASKEIRVTAVPALLSLANSKDGLRELREELDNVGGKLQKMADEQADTLTGKVTLLKSAWDGLLLSLGKTDGVLSKATGKLAEVLNQSRDMIVLGRGTAEQKIAYYQKGASEEGFRDVVDEYKALGITDEKEMAKAAQAELAKLKKKSEEMEGVIDELRHLDPRGKDYFAKLEEYFGSAQERGSRNVYQIAAELRDLISNYENVATELSKAAPIVDENKKTPTLSEKGPEKQAKDNVEDALRRYQEAMDLATAEYQNEVIDEKQWFRKKINAEESVYKAYAEAYAIFKDPKFKEGMQEWMQKVADTSANLTHMNEALDAMTEEMKRKEAEQKRKEAEQKALVDADKSIYGQMKSAVGKGSWERIAQDGGDLNARFAAMKVKLDGGVEIPDKDWEDFVADLNEKLVSLKLAPIQLDLEAGTVSKMANEVKDIATKWGYVAQAVSSVGSALQSIEDPSSKIAGIVATAVASTALGFAQAATADSKFGTFAWIAAAAAGLANMTAMIASIKQVTAEYHADGGFVGGGPRGTDTINTWLTPGELVLNRAQQTNLAAQLQPAQMFNPNDFHLEAEIRADKFRVMLLQNDRLRGGTGNQYRIK